MTLETILKGITTFVTSTALAFSLYSCGDDPVGCTDDSECRSPRVCRNYECVSPSGNGGNGGYDAGDEEEGCECDRTVGICNVKALGISSSGGPFVDCNCDPDCPPVDGGPYSCQSDGYCITNTGDYVTAGAVYGSALTGFAAAEPEIEPVAAEPEQPGFFSRLWQKS